MSGEVDAGARLGSLYVLDQRIGGGAMGTVWAAHNTETDQAVAIKILSDGFSQNSDVVGRFLRERSALLSVKHPHLVEIRDVVVENERIALVMELVEGSDAAKLLERGGPMPLPQVLRLGGEISEALMAVHAAGIVHRDLKPANILVESASSGAKLVDFGIAWIAGNPRLTAANSVIGTPHYLAPELLTGGDVTPAADVYALAICMYQLLSGVVPFDGEHYAQILYRHLNEAPQPHPAIPAQLWPLIEAMLAKDPAARPSTEAVAGQLAALANGEAPAAAPAAQSAVEEPSLYSSVPPNPFGEYEMPTSPEEWAAQSGEYPVQNAYAAPAEYPADQYSAAEPYPAPEPYSAAAPDPYGRPPEFGPITYSKPFGDPPPFGYESERTGGRSRKRLLVIVGVCVLAVCGAGAGAWAVLGGGNQKPAAGPSSSASAAPTPVKQVAHHWTLCCGQLQEAGGTTTATDNGVVLNSTNQGDAVFNGKAGTQIVVDGPVIDTEQSFTLAFWMHMTGATAATSGRQTVVEQRGTQGCAACVEFDPTANRLVFEMQSDDTSHPTTARVEALAAPAPAQWYRIIASYNDRTHSMSLYIGGVLQGSKKFDAEWVPTGPLSFGSGLEKGITTNWYDGSLADMWIWNRALTPSQVDQAAK